MGAELVAVDAGEEFFAALKGVTDPEQKRKIVGEKFIRIFEREARKLGAAASFLVQGTIYPDVVEFGRAGPQQGRQDQDPTTTWAGCPRIWKWRWSSRCATCSRTRCGRWAKRSGCRRRWSGASRSRARA